jgi:hypothetical protein
MKIGDNIFFLKEWSISNEFAFDRSIYHNYDLSIRV